MSAIDLAELEPYRADLLAHCRRLMGDPHDAEDQVQETMLRAWRSAHTFEGRSSVRTWLHRIATNVCLTALDQRGRLPMPAGEPALYADAAGTPAGHESDPAAVFGARESSKQAILVAWQRLTARQRAVLVLLDVLGWQAEEVADLLGTSPTAVYSVVRRARRQLSGASAENDGGPVGPATGRLLDEYARAFEDGDVGALVGLLTEDVTCDRSSTPERLSGRTDILRYLRHCPAFGQCRIVPVTVRGRTALGIYREAGDGTYRAHGIDVLTTTAAGLSHIEVLEDRSLFAAFGLPLTWAA
jgi:RNA polymerase sigma-70 factor (ECF subfamily)